jgi:hypothetical protein
MRSRAWTGVFSSTHSTRAGSGGLTYRSTMSRFLDEQRVGRELEGVSEMGLQPECQIRFTFDRLIPMAVAIEQTDQCVAPLGVSSRVFTTIRSMSWSLTERGTPGRGSSWRGRRVGAERTSNALANGDSGDYKDALPLRRWCKPSAYSSTTRHRRASAWALVGRRADRSSVSRSSSLRTRSSIGLPHLAIIASHRR